MRVATRREPIEFVGRKRPVVKAIWDMKLFELMNENDV